MKYIVESYTHQLQETFDTNEMNIHYQSCKDLSFKKEEEKKQEEIDKMINIFNSQLEWDNLRIKAYFEAANYIINGGMMNALSKIQKASKNGHFETNLIEFSKYTIISPKNSHNIKLLGMIYHTKYNNFYSANNLPYLIDLIKNVLKPYNIIFWKPRKNLWVIQAKWNDDINKKSEKNNTDSINYTYGNDELDYSSDESNYTDNSYNSNYSNENKEKYNSFEINCPISKSLLYNNS